MASGLLHATPRPLRTRFPSGSGTPIPWPRCTPQLAGLFYKRHAATLAGRDILPVHGFRFCFTPLAGVLFTFPSRYSFAIGSCIVFSLGSWSTRIQAGFLVPRPTQVPHQEVRTPSRTRLSRPPAGLPRPFRWPSGFITPRVIPVRPCNPARRRFGLLPFRSPLLRESLLISSPGLLRWFTSPGLAPPPYFIQACGARLAARGLPHSAIPGSADVCSSPGLFAACRGLPRLAAPPGIRHGPISAWPYHSFRPARHASSAPAAPQARAPPEPGVPQDPPQGLHGLRRLTVTCPSARGKKNARTIFPKSYKIWDRQELNL